LSRYIIQLRKIWCGGEDCNVDDGDDDVCGGDYNYDCSRGGSDDERERHPSIDDSSLDHNYDIDNDKDDN